LKQPIDIQDTFLSQAQQSKTPLTVFLINGFPIRGTLKGFDNFTVEIESEGKQQVIFKHVISTIAPQHPIKFRPIAQN